MGTSSVLLELVLLLLLLESVPYIGGGAWVGKGCSSSALVWGLAGAGVLGTPSDGRVFAGSPGNGKRSEGDGCFWSGGVQGLSVEGLVEDWEV